MKRLATAELVVQLAARLETTQGRAAGCWAGSSSEMNPEHFIYMFTLPSNFVCMNRRGRPGLSLAGGPYKRASA